MRYDGGVLTRGVLLLGVLLIGPGMAAAQPTAAPASPQDSYYARYETPGMCEQAARRMVGFATREWQPPPTPDTAVYSPIAGSLPPLAVRTARACAARFNIATVPERELLNLAQLYLLGNQEQLAQAAITRLLAVRGSMPGVEPTTRAVERGWVYWLLSQSFRDTGPTRMAQAQHYLQQLDALGAPVARWRLFAHTESAEYALRANELPTAITEARTAIAAIPQMIPTDRLDYRIDLMRAYRQFVEPIQFQARLAEPSRFQASLAAADATIREVIDHAVIELPPGWSRDSQYVVSGLSSMRSPTQLAQAPQIQAAFWYNTSRDAASRPRLGEVTLVVFASPNCGGWCYGWHERLKRLHAKYAAAGLHILLVDETVGWFRAQLVGPLHGDRAAELAKEAELRRGYLLDYLQLPGVLAIEATQYTRLADGRRKNALSHNLQGYPASGGRGAYLVDKNGTIRLALQSLESPYRERVVDTIIQAALR